MVPRSPRSRTGFRRKCPTNPDKLSYEGRCPKPSLHAVTARLLDEFGELSSSTSTPFGWSGSVTNYFAPFMEPFRKLLQHPKPEVRSWAKVDSLVKTRFEEVPAISHI